MRPRHANLRPRNLEARIAGDTLLTSVLDIKLGEHELRYYFKSMIGAGIEAGVLAAELAVSEDVGAQLAGEYRARQRWISMVALMRRSAEFAGWSAAEMQTVFGALDTQTAGRRAPRVARRRRRGGPGAYTYAQSRHLKQNGPLPMARNLLTLRTGELLSLCREIVAARAVLERYPLTAGYVTVLREAHAALEQATRPAASAEAVIARAELQRTLAAQGRDFARLSTELATLLDTLALVRPTRAISCRAARRALFPDGLRVVTTSLRNRAGQASRLRSLAEQPSPVRQLLEELVVDGEPLMAWLARLIASAEALSQGLSRLGPPPDRRARRQALAAARARCISALNQLRSAAAFAGWTPAETQRVLGPLTKLSTV